MACLPLQNHAYIYQHHMNANILDDSENDAFGFAELFARIKRGLPQIIGWACLGLALGAIAFVATSPFRNVSTTTRVVFSFPGFEKGEYPDKSKFSSDDLRSPEIIAAALQRKGLEATDDLQSKLRAALSIVGIIPDSVVKERDKQRAAGLTPRVYIPDEFVLTLNLPRSFPLNAQERQNLLNEIVSIYREKFIRNYIELPTDMGNAFESLVGADYYDYELVLSRESQNISAFLAEMAETARSFRSQRTNLSFNDLIRQNQLFTQIRLNEVLGLIRRDGLSRNRDMALLKMDYYLQILSDQELSASEDEKVVRDLLKQAQDREQRFALGVRSQATQQRPDGLVVDQGLVDSLLANDAYNFLVREALRASLKTRRIQSEKAILQDRRKNMDSFVKSDASDQSAVMKQFEASLTELRRVYEELMNNIRLTYEDHQRQQFKDAIRVSMQATTESIYRRLLMAAFAGFAIGGSLGLGLSLLGITGAKRQS